MVVGAFVYIKDEKSPILYKISQIDNEKLYVSGVYYRITKIVNLKDVIEATNDQIDEERKKMESRKDLIIQAQTRSRKFILGKVLHIDGDEEYLKRCLDLYEKMNIYAYGITLKEEEIAGKIEKYVIELCPDIVVITGHDLYNNQGLKDLNNYANTKNYMEAVKAVRKIKSKYDCVIIAGACQSNFEALIASGADFASSPKRINIHTFDPVVIAIKVATTSFIKVVSINDIYRYIENGKDAFNGVETLGKMRLLQ